MAKRGRRPNSSPSGRALIVAGLLLFLAGSIALLGIITAEALYPPPYRTGANEISDLGSSEFTGKTAHEPSATIFNSAMMAVGVLTMAASYLIHLGTIRRLLAILVGLFGLGALGVGVFPGQYGNVHALFALLAFFAGGLAAIAALQIVGGPFRYISIILGLVSLATVVLYLVLHDADPMLALGRGGIERWVVYPIVLWVAGFGGYLMARPHARRI